MPSLPTVDLPEATIRRVMTAFGGEENYRSWLLAQVTEHVKGHERAEINAQVERERRERHEAVPDLDVPRGPRA